MALTPEQEAAVTCDGLLRALARLDLARHVGTRGEAELNEAARIFGEYLDEIRLDTDKPDAYDRLLLDVFGVILLHLKDGDTDVLGAFAEYRHQSLKMRHGCYDMTCPECDK